MSKPEFINYPEVNKDSNEDSVYGDCIRHCTGWQGYFRGYDRNTGVHEGGGHKISADIRNKNYNLGKINAFYCLKNRAMILKDQIFENRALHPTFPRNYENTALRLMLLAKQIGTIAPCISLMNLMPISLVQNVQ